MTPGKIHDVSHMASKQNNEEPERLIEQLQQTTTSKDWIPKSNGVKENMLELSTSDFGSTRQPDLPPTGGALFARFGDCPGFCVECQPLQGCPGLQGVSGEGARSSIRVIDSTSVNFDFGQFLGWSISTTVLHQFRPIWGVLDFGHFEFKVGPREGGAGTLMRGGEAERWRPDREKLSNVSGERAKFGSSRGGRAVQDPQISNAHTLKNQPTQTQSTHRHITHRHTTHNTPTPIFTTLVSLLFDFGHIFDSGQSFRCRPISTSAGRNQIGRARST